MSADLGADIDIGEGSPSDSTSGTQDRRFRVPVKVIKTPDDLKAFRESETYKKFMGFVLKLNTSIMGVELPGSSDTQDLSPNVTKVIQILETLGTWVDEIPPVKHAVRYGNPAFRTWFEKLSAGAEEMNKSLLPAHLQSASIELAPYFIDSFGNATRIDYGTGHETTFVAWLYCCCQVDVFTEADTLNIVTRVFNAYLQLMRKIQTAYWLEPAGSHGVWGLDDYCFLPFLWGASQLINHPTIEPKSIHVPDVLVAYSETYYYLGAVMFVSHVKKGYLSETSPMLNDISGVPSWSKVNEGMIKMYKAEVLDKVPIMQHFLFGSILPLER